MPQVTTINKRLSKLTTQEGNANLFLNSQRLICTTLFLILAGAVEPAAQATDKRTHPLFEFYDTAVCAAASVEAITVDSTIANVKLKIEISTSTALSAMSTSNRDEWFNLHCPSIYHSIWRKMPSVTDVNITAQLNIGHYSLSCAQYRNARQAEFTSVKNRVQNKLKKLLQR